MTLSSSSSSEACSRVEEARCSPVTAAAVARQNLPRCVEQHTRPKPWGAARRASPHGGGKGMHAHGTRGKARASRLRCGLVIVRPEEACAGRAPCSARRFQSPLLVAQAVCAVALAHAGCSFDESPIIGRGTAHNAPSNGSSDESVRAGFEAPPLTSDRDADANDSMQAGNGGNGGRSGSGAGGSAPPDAGTNDGDPVPGVPECPLQGCAPDDQCKWTRFAGSVYYFCEIARSQADAVERCAEV